VAPQSWFISSFPCVLAGASADRVTGSPAILGFALLIAVTLFRLPFVTDSLVHSTAQKYFQLLPVPACPPVRPRQLLSGPWPL